MRAVDPDGCTREAACLAVGEVGVGVLYPRERIGAGVVAAGEVIADGLGFADGDCRAGVGNAGAVEVGY